MWPHECCELIPQMCPCDYTTAWADRSWEQNSHATSKRVEVIIKSAQGQEQSVKLQGSLSCAILWERDSFHEWSLDFSFIRRFTVNETSSSWNLSQKRNTRASKSGRKELKWWLWQEQSTPGFQHLCAFNCACSWSEWSDLMLPCLHQRQPGLTLNIRGQKQSNPRQDWTKRMQGCWLSVCPLPLHCLWYFESPDCSDLPVSHHG